MIPRQLWIFLVLVLLVGVFGSPAVGQRVTLQIDLSRLHGPELLRTIHAALPSAYSEEQDPKIDLPTLMELHTGVQRSTPFQSRLFPPSLSDVEGRLQHLMRREVEAMDLPTLRSLALGDRGDSLGDWRFFPVICQRWITAEVKKLQSEPKRKLTFPAEPPPLPEELKSMWSDGGGAEIDRAVGPFAKLILETSKKRSRGLHAEHDDFTRLARTFFSVRRRDAAAELLRFEWDSWCGTGAPEFEGTKLTLAFMALLRERRLEEAVGASLLVPHGPEWLREPGRAFEPWRNDLLSYCGFDAEALMLEAGKLSFLAAAGSEKAAQRAIALWRTRSAEHGLLLWALSEPLQFLVPGGPQEWDKADPRTAISAETQREIIELLIGTWREDLPFHELDQWLRYAEELRRPETKETLRGLVKHPSATFAERAAQVHRVMGENIEQILPAPPVRFRIYLNDQPWRAADLWYQFVNGTAHRWNGSVATDAEGFATIPRDDFLDPGKRAQRLRFTAGPLSGGSRSPSASQFEKPWVAAEIPMPQAFDETVKLDLIACTVPIEIQYGSAPPPTSVAAMHVTLRKAGPPVPDAGALSLKFESEPSPPPDRLILSTIAPGVYEVEIVAPGSARHVSEPFEVKTAMPPLKVRLEKGSHIYATIWTPENARGAHELRLFRGSEDVTEQYASSGRQPLFAGVPKGTYRLQILSTAEFMQRHQITTWETGRGFGPDPKLGVDCEGFMHEFTISEDSPPLLDLGRLENAPTPEMRSKAGQWRPLTSGLRIR